MAAAAYFFTLTDTDATTKKTRISTTELGNESRSAIHVMGLQLDKIVVN
jgi:hypothetical protein